MLFFIENILTLNFGAIIAHMASTWFWVMAGTALFYFFVSKKLFPGLIFFWALLIGALTFMEVMAHMIIMPLVLMIPLQFFLVYWTKGNRFEKHETSMVFFGAVVGFGLWLVLSG